MICTPHLGASTEQAQVNVAIAVADRVYTRNLNGGWSEVPAVFDAAIVGLSAGYVITAGGELRGVSSEGSTELVQLLDFTPTAIIGDPAATVLRPLRPYGDSTATIAFVRRLHCDCTTTLLRPCYVYKNNTFFPVNFILSLTFNE